MFVKATSYHLQTRDESSMAYNYNINVLVPILLYIFFVKKQLVFSNILTDQRERDVFSDGE